MFKLLLILSLIFPITVWGISPFDEGLDLGRQHTNDAQNALNEFKKNDNAALKEFLPNFDKLPDPAKFYEGSEQEKSDLKEKGIEAALDDKNTDVILDSQKSKKKKVEEEGNWIEGVKDQSSILIKESSKTAEDLNKDLVDCSKPQYCKTEWVEKTCHSKPDQILENCQKTLKIDVSHTQNIQHFIYRTSVKMHKDWHNYGGVHYNLNNNEITWKDPSEGDFRINGFLPTNIPCDSIIGSWHVVRANSTNAIVDDIKYPSCSDRTLNLHFKSNKRLEIEVEINLAVNSTKSEFNDRWENECLSYENLLHCQKINDQCVIENETRIFEGIPITRECWERDLEFNCKNIALAPQTNCAELTQKGCQLIASNCEDENQKPCRNYLQKFKCPITTCMDTSVICSPKTYCEGESCGESPRKADPDFGNAVTKLSAAINAGSELKGGYIFSGEPKSCNAYVFNTVNCCDDKGWLKDVSNLFACGIEAIELGRAREEGKAIREIGHHEESPIRDMHVFCIFPTKLARIVQEQGRRDQLGIGFGNWKHPNCRGLSPEELQAIDFGKIDFSEYIADLAAKEANPDFDSLKKQIQIKMNRMIEENKKHD